MLTRARRLRIKLQEQEASNIAETLGQCSQTVDLSSSSSSEKSENVVDIAPAVSDNNDDRKRPVKRRRKIVKSASIIKPKTSK